jgi:HEAT repeat protein
LYVYELRKGKRKALGDAWVYHRSTAVAHEKSPRGLYPFGDRVGPLGIVEDPAAHVWSIVWAERGDGVVVARDGQLVLYVDLDADPLSDEGLHSRAVVPSPEGRMYLPWDEDVYQYIVWSIRPLSAFEHEADRLAEEARAEGACTFTLLPRPPGGIEFGKARNSFRKVKPKDALKHPIWAWTFDDEPGHDEETVKPVTNTDDVTPRLGQWVLSITLKVEGTDTVGMGWYEHDRAALTQLTVWQGERFAALDEVEGLSYPLTLTSVAKIWGRDNVQFICEDPKADLARCTQALDEVAGPAASTAEVSSLVADLESGHIETALAAVDALTARSTDAAVAALCEAVTGNSDARVRLRAAFALWKIASPAAVAALGEALEKDPEVAVRLRATYALRQARSPAAAAPLARALLDDSDARVRGRAALSLQLLGNAEAAPALAQALSDPDPAVRHHAAHSLQWVTSKPEVAEAVRTDPRIEEATMGTLRDDSDSVRAQACRALRHVGSPRAVPPLLHAAQGAGKMTAFQVVETLCAIGDERAAPFLLEQLPTHSLRVSVMFALGRLRYQAAVPALLAIVEDRSDSYGGVAAEALGQIGDPAALPVLERAAEADYHILREKAQKALKAIRGTAAG